MRLYRTRQTGPRRTVHLSVYPDAQNNNEVKGGKWFVLAQFTIQTVMDRRYAVVMSGVCGINAPLDSISIYAITFFISALIQNYLLIQ